VPGTVASSLADSRERAIRLLTDGYAYDAITEEEFEWRLGQLSHADSPAAIDALVADLATASQTGLAPGTGYSAAARLEGRIIGIMSETRRQGPWRVPRKLRVFALMSDVRLDLRYAAIPDGCTISVMAIMANVSLIVPPGLAVDFDVTPVMASTRNDAKELESPGYRVPHVHVQGAAVMSEVRVRVRSLAR
jgi:hypothetical protein